MTISLRIFFLLSFLVSTTCGKPAGQDDRSVDEDEVAGSRPGLHTDNCYVIKFWEQRSGESTQPSRREIPWVTSGAWNSQDDELLVASSLESQIYRISQDGVVTEIPQETFRSCSAGDAPIELRVSHLQAASNSLLLEDERSGSFCRFDEKLEFIGSISFDDRAVGSTGLLKEIWRWIPWNEGVLAFGDIAYDSGNWESVFLYLDSSEHRVYDLRVDIGRAVRRHYLLGYPYVAAVDGSGYILLKDEKPAIIEVNRETGDLRELEFFPEDFRLIPRLERTSGWSGPRQTTAYYQAIESKEMAVALLGWDQRLYLLAKEAISEELETSWWLIEFDGSDGREKIRSRLPTAAAHLVVVPGNKFWALIEGSPVEGVTSRQIPYVEFSSMVLVPEHWLRIDGGRRLEDGAKCVSVGR